LTLAGESKSRLLRISVTRNIGSGLRCGVAIDTIHLFVHILVLIFGLAFKRLSLFFIVKRLLVILVIDVDDLCLSRWLDGLGK
jgi:hypothetical protein